MIFFCYRYRVSAEGEKPESKQKRLEQKYAALQIVPNVDKFGTAKVNDLISLSHQLFS